MKNHITRRRFVAAAGISALGASALAKAQDANAPAAIVRGAIKPIVVCSANGNISKNSEGETAVAKAFRMITLGSDVLDAVVAGVNILELDPEETSVGFGGLPNADGVTQLDSSVMHGPKKRAGAVAAIEGVRTPSLVAMKVMQETDHHLIVGKDAQQFAKLMGFAVEPDMHTAKSRKIYQEWKRRIDPEHYLDPKTRADAGRKAAMSMIRDGLIDPLHYFGTINCNGINSNGEVCGVTTTSGLAFKISGRVGDSPILGAGLYVDGQVGAAGSTGRGEANLFGLCSFLIVENMRNGMSPKDAGMAALKRVAANTIEKRLLTSRGTPKFDINYYVLNTKGEYAGLSLYEKVGNSPVRYSVCDESGPRFMNCDFLFPGTSAD